MEPEVPLISDASAASLRRTGLDIRARRRALGVSALAAAESAGMSRTTWHRIERGNPSVAKSSYAKALEVLQPLETGHAGDGTAWILLADYPELSRLAWHVGGLVAVTPAEALSMYERHWRHLDRDALIAKELDLIEMLRIGVAGGRLLV